MSADVNYVGEVRPNPGNKADACCEICGALLVCLSCGNHRTAVLNALQADVALWRRRAEWQEITPENLPKVGDEVISVHQTVVLIEEEGYFTRLTAQGWKRGGYTHFRPINPPEPR